MLYINLWLDRTCSSVNSQGLGNQLDVQCAVPMTDFTCQIQDVMSGMGGTATQTRPLSQITSVMKERLPLYIITWSAPPPPYHIHTLHFPIHRLDRTQRPLPSSTFYLSPSP